MKKSLTILLILFTTKLFAQNVGIGEPFPILSKLQVKSNDSAVMLLHNATTSGVDIKTSLFYKTGNFYSGGIATIGNTSTFRLGLFTYGSSLASGLLERMSILDGGNVGIGTTNPLMKFHVSNTDSAVAIFENTQTLNTDIKNALYFKTGNTNPYTGAIKTIGQSTNSARLGLFTFSNSNANNLKERLSILDNGNVGIGTTTPSSALEINGQIKITGGTPGVGQLLESDANGLATWSDKSASFLPAGAIGNTLRNNGSSWVSTSNLFNNGTNIGIGTTTPASPLSFASIGGDKINLYQEATNQIYGMGITTGTLQIYTPNTGARNIAFGAGSSATFVQSALLTNTGSFSIQGGDAGYIFKDRTDNTYGGWNWYANAGKASLYRYGSGDLMTFNANGSVCIGTTTPATGYMLNVYGKIIGEEVRVQLKAAWPDYVFDHNYKKLSLPELEKYVAQNKHLPNIPSAAEVEKDGQLLGDVQRKMLEKIEELSLYIIEQNKKIEALEKRMDEKK